MENTLNTTNTLNQIDIMVLPEESRKILIEFYYFLVEKYREKQIPGKKISCTTSVVNDLLPKRVEHFVPLKREEIYGR